MKRFLTLIHTIILAATALAAGAPELSFQHYTIENGLPSNCVRDIRQDSEGFIWFATDGGLVRFDGHRATTFLPEGAMNSLVPNSYAMSLCMKGDDLIVGMTRNVYRFDRRLERLAALPLKYPKGMKPISRGEIRYVECDSLGNLWVAVNGYGVYEIDSEMRVVRVHDFPEIGNNVATVLADSHNNIWCVSSTKSGGVFRLDRNTNSFKRFPIKIGQEETEMQALVMMEDEAGDYWLGTWTRGLLKFDPVSGNVTRASGGEGSDAIYHIHSIAQLSASKLLVGSDRGLVLYDIPSGQHTFHRPDELHRRSLSNQFVYPVFRDREGGVWVGTFYGGVNYMAPDTKHIRQYAHSQYRNSVSGNVVSRFAEDADGNVWIASDDGGVCRYNPSTDVFTSYPLQPSGRPDNVHALCVDDDNVWVGTYSAGAGPLDIKTGRWTSVPLEGHGTNYSCYTIMKDRHGTVWMGAENCLNRYDAERGMFVTQHNLGSWVVDIREDSKHRLWVATQGNGVFLYNPYYDTWTNYRPTKENGNLPHSHVNQVLVTPEGRVVVATVNGAAVFEEEKNSFRPISGTTQSKNVEAMELAEGYLWLATDSGLERIQKDGQSRVFSTSDGIMSGGFSSGAAFLASDGRMYLGTVNGFCTIFPSEIQINKEVPQIRFTGLEVVNRRIEVGDPLLSESLNSIDKLVLSHQDHSFSVYFSALSYPNPEANRYAYRLKGFDKDWIAAGKENRATYSNLPPGTYTLQVTASNNDGVWNEEGVSLKIEVLPVWYASWWMRCVYFLVFAAAIGSLVIYDRRRREQAHESELRRVSANKEKEVYRTKLSFFTIVAHEIRTPVSLIIGPLEKVMESAKSFPKDVRTDLDMIDRNAKRLLSLVNQMLDFKKAEESALPTEFHHTRLIPVIESVVERFIPSMEHRGIMLHAIYPDGDPVADICPESFTKLVSNLLNNACKFTKDRVTLSLRVSDTDGTFTVSVEDNGIGIRKENLQKIFTPFYQIIDNINESRGGTGLGLSIVKSVAESHGGSVSVESEPGKWSRFTAVFPLHQKNVVPDEPAAQSADDNEPTQKEVAVKEESKLPVMLVVDDNPEMLSYITSSMSAEYTVLTAANGRDALDTLRKREVQMVVCDWMMPVMDGLTLLKHVRRDRELSHIPFVMLTAKTDSRSKIDSMKEGADAYVEKPFSMSFLKARIANLVEMRAKLREKYSSDPLAPVETLAPHPLEDDFLERLNAIIIENMANEEFSVDFLAEKLNISRSGLYAKIRTLANVTPKEMIRIVRLKKAASLILENRISIADISYQTGFNTPSYFTKSFRMQFGMTPSEFAEKAKVGDPAVDSVIH